MSSSLMGLLTVVVAIASIAIIDVVNGEHACMHNHLLRSHPPLRPHLHRTEQNYTEEVNSKRKKKLKKKK
jgi:hypothetical protein